jgi:transcriptional regulator with XRE-family HTH domain
MADDADDDDIEFEIRRLRELLLQTLDEKRLSVRALERKLGVAVGTRRKVLNGSVGLTFRNILEILKAAGVDRTAFFRAAYAGGSDPDAALRRLIRSELRSMLLDGLRPDSEEGQGP